MNSRLVIGTDAKSAFADAVIQAEGELQKSLPKFTCSGQNKILCNGVKLLEFGLTLVCVGKSHRANILRLYFFVGH